MVRVDVCGWIACREPTSCRCKRDVRANDDGVYRIREDWTEDDCGLNNSFIFSSPLPLLSILLVLPDQWAFPSPFGFPQASFSKPFLTPLYSRFVEYNVAAVDTLFEEPLHPYPQIANKIFSFAGSDHLYDNAHAPIS